MFMLIVCILILFSLKAYVFILILKRNDAKKKLRKESIVKKELKVGKEEKKEEQEA